MDPCDSGDQAHRLIARRSPFWMRALAELTTRMLRAAEPKPALPRATPGGHGILRFAWAKDTASEAEVRPVRRSSTGMPRGVWPRKVRSPATCSGCPGSPGRWHPRRAHGAPASFDSSTGTEMRPGPGIRNAHSEGAHWLSAHSAQLSTTDGRSPYWRRVPTEVGVSPSFHAVFSNWAIRTNQGT